MNDMFDYMTPFTEFYMNLKPIYKIGFFVFLYVFFKFVSYIRSSYDVNSKRRETPCEFVDGITEEQFKSLVYYFADKTPRLKNITVSGPVVIGEIISQTRKTTWIFRIDFNDYGHITGRYWLMNGNYQSRIPRRLASNISEGVIYYLNGDKTKGRSRRLRNARRSSWFKQKRIEIAPFVAFFSVAAFICLGLYGWHIYREWKFIHPPISCYDMISMNYEDLTKKLVDAGFTNITYVPDVFIMVLSQNGTRSLPSYLMTEKID